MIKENRYYDKKNNRLVYINNKATNEYWDEHWENDNFEKLVRIKSNKFIETNTNKYLKKGDKILEGGCGRGQNVYLLQHIGYECIGLDYAKNTVELINKKIPEIDVRLGDVRNLKFEDNSFDGYWSLGVIEHFYNGYDDIANEMYRVLKLGGVLFMTVPTMSNMRFLKAKLNLYPNWNEDKKKLDCFYQFALDPKKIVSTFEEIGFEVLEIKPYDGFKGLKDEMGLLKPLLQKIYESDNLLLRVIRKSIDIIVKPFSSHMTLFILRKK